MFLGFLGGAGVFWLKSRIPKAKILGILEFLNLNLEFLAEFLRNSRISNEKI